VFAENGYLGSQQKDIAQLAGVSSPLLSYHFKNKEDIWKQAIHMISEDLRNRLAQTRRFLKDLKGIPLLKAYNRQIYYLFAEHPNFAKILLQEMGTDTWRAEYLTEQRWNPPKNFLGFLSIFFCPYLWALRQRPSCYNI